MAELIDYPSGYIGQGPKTGLSWRSLRSVGFGTELDQLVDPTGSTATGSVSKFGTGSVV